MEENQYVLDEHSKMVLRRQRNEEAELRDENRQLQEENFQMRNLLHRFDILLRIHYTYFFNKRYFLIKCIIYSGSTLNLINMNCSIMHYNKVNIMNDRMYFQLRLVVHKHKGFVHLREQIEQKTPLMKFYVSKDAIFSYIELTYSS